VREGRWLPAAYAADFSRLYREKVHKSADAAEGACAFAEKRRPNWVAATS
jgi:hypothetical protein